MVGTNKEGFLGAIAELEAMTRQSGIDPTQLTQFARASRNLHNHLGNVHDQDVLAAAYLEYASTLKVLEKQYNKKLPAAIAEHVGVIKSYISGVPECEKLHLSAMHLAQEIATPLSKPAFSRR